MFLRVATGVLLLLGFAVNGLVRIVYEVCDPCDLSVDHRLIADYDEERFEGLKPLLPPDAVVGYLDDAGARQETHVDRCYLLQYTLAPRLLVRGTGPMWTIENFTDAGQPLQHPESKLLLVKDFGNGVRLYRTKVR
jgi:hypothetical protein